MADREATKKSDAADYFVRKVLALHRTLVWGIHTSKFLTVRATTDLWEAEGNHCGSHEEAGEVDRSQ